MWLISPEKQNAPRPHGAEAPGNGYQAQFVVGMNKPATNKTKTTTTPTIMSGMMKLFSSSANPLSMLFLSWPVAGLLAAKAVDRYPVCRAD
jgi:hypothetical protein